MRFTLGDGGAADGAIAWTGFQELMPPRGAIAPTTRASRRT
jgi:hypothetical protein